MDVPGNDVGEEGPLLRPAVLTSLRRSATVAHAFPGIRLRLRVEGTVVVEVGRGPWADPVATWPRMGPCAFRRWVVRAEASETAGLDLAVDVGMQPGNEIQPDGLYRVRLGHLDVNVFPTILPVRVCREVIERVDISALRHPSASDALRLQHDVLTGVTMVHTVSRHAPHAGRHPVLDDLVAMLATEEIVREVAATVRRPA
jgi:hypothetical protein